jgi:hypothetical protein
VKFPKKVDTALLASIDANERTQALAQEAAQALIAAGEPTPGDVSEVKAGARFVLPIVVPEGVETGDGRSFAEGSTEVRDLPLPLLWQEKTGDKHDGAYIVGRIDSVERLNDKDHPGLGNARGVFDTGPYGREAERLVREKFLRGTSADLDKFEATVEGSEELGADDNTIKNDKIKVSSSRLMAVTLVPKPAFQECTIELEDETDPDYAVEDGVYEEATDDVEATLSAIAASAAPVVPPREWFTRPKLTGPTPITVTDDGQVFGHIAAWSVDHIGLPRGTKPPRSKSNYAYFRTGVLRTTDGDVPVGQLTLAGGHASLNATAAEAVKHYDDTASAVADVTAGEDSYGIWVAGALRPEASPEQVRALRASAPSGDWRPINGKLELVAVCQVNVPGFPIARAMVAGGQLTALVAAGARPLAEMRDSKLHQLETRLNELESIHLSSQRTKAASRLAALRSEHDIKARDTLSALVHEADERQAAEEAMIASAKSRIIALGE